MTTYVRGTFARSNQVSEDSLVRDVLPSINLFRDLRYNAPVWMLLNKLGKNKRNVTNMKYECFDDDYVAFKTTISSTTTVAASTSQTITVTERSLFTLGDVIYNVNRSGYVRVASAVSGTGAGNLTVDCIDGVGANWTASDVILNLGTTGEENWADPAMIEQQLSSRYNYCEIVDTTISISEIAEESKQYGGDRYAYLTKKKIEEHAGKLERKIMFGMRYTGTGSSGTYWTTGGLADSTVGISSANIFNLSGATLDKATFEKTHLYTIFKNGGSASRWLITGAAGLMALTSMYTDSTNATMNIEPGEDTYGVAVKKIITPFGDLQVIRHNLLNEDNYGTVWGNSMFIIDPAHIGLVGFQGMGGAKIFRERANNNVFTKSDVIHSIMGVELRLQDVHGIIKNFALA